jgi:hypothetical protein
MIGTDKIIFCVNRSATMDVDYHYIVVTYSEPFTIEVQEIDIGDLNYNKEPWYDNYYFTYKYLENKNEMIIRIYDNKIKIDYYNDKETDFQFGDNHTDKIKLSNGDIMFNNFGDVNSCLIFTCNSPKIKIYKNLDSYKSNEEYDAISDIFLKDKYYDKKSVDKIFETIKSNSNSIIKKSNAKYFI